MSDFDDLLERLLTEPAFAGALAADPAAALAGYRLTDEERSLLRSQLTGDAGGQRAVEARANQSSTMGLLAGFLGSGLTGSGLGDGGFGPADPPGTAGFGAADPSGTAGFGAADPSGTAGFGAADPSGTAGFGAAQPGPGGPAGVSAGPPMNAAQVPSYHLPEGYHIRVDVDGDGDWDRHTLHARADGGVDVYVDANRDGRVDFVGHDDDADGRVESADYDKNHDGFFEKTMYDDTGDGWLDRTVRHRQPPSGLGDALGPS